MPGRDIIVIGASAGGVEALRELVARLPADLPAAVFIAVHTAPTSSGLLAPILDRSGPLKALVPEDGEPIAHGHVYVAPPDHHLLLRPGSTCIARGPKENGFRPAVDPLFRTAAASYRGRVVGIVLSGGLDDGTSGLLRIKEQSGIAIAQDPEEAAIPSMPLSAIQSVSVDHILRIAQMPEVLSRLATEPLPRGVKGMASRRRVQPDVAEVGSAALEAGELKTPPSQFVCPECGGALWEMSDGKLLRYRCHVGHGYTAQSLDSAQTEDFESALWSAMRVLEENASLRRRMAERAERRSVPSLGEQYRRDAEDSERRAAALRRILVSEPEQVARLPQKRPAAGEQARQPADSAFAGAGNGQRRRQRQRKRA